MRAGIGVNWLLGCSSRNAEAVKKAKSALKHIFFLIFLVLFDPRLPFKGTCSGGQEGKMNITLTGNLTTI